MLYRLFENFLLGLVITATPGAVIFATIRRALVGRASVAPFLVGNFIGMAVVIAAAFAGIAAIAADGHMARAWYAIGGVVLLYIGVGSMRHATFSRQIAVVADSTAQKSAAIEGLVLAVANPLSLLFWVAIVGSLSRSDAPVLEVVAMCTSIVLGAAIALAGVVMVARYAGAKLTPVWLKGASRVCGAIVCGYGLLALYRAWGA